MTPRASAGVKHRLLVLSTLILAFNYVDRQVLALVLESIKIDLQLTDTQLGLLSGIAFAAFYAVMGLPIARWADRGNRVTIIAASTAVWSVFVALCGAATSLVQLFLVRIGVAIGEAGCIPPAQSLLSDFFPRPERTRAFAIYSLGGPLSVVLGGFVAGWLNEFYGWRATFIILGCPGLLLALLACLWLHDPRSRSRATHSMATPVRSLREVGRLLWNNTTFRHLLIAHTVLYFFVYGVVIQWQPTFFIRTHGLSTGELGTWMLLSAVLLGSLGTYGGGMIVHRHMARDEPRQLRLMGVSIAIYGMLSVGVYLSSSRYVALGLVALATPFYTALFGPMFAVNQSIVPASMRATAVALMLFFANLLGMGLGGFVTGVVSDVLSAVYHAESLRYALLGLSPGFFWCALHFWWAASTVDSDIEKARIESVEAEALPEGLRA